MTENDKITQRKVDHIQIALNPSSQFDKKQTGFETYHFVHKALPEIDFNDILLNTTFLGKAMKSPFIISSMTGGPEQGHIINKNLAIAAQQLGVAMGVGSQRIALEQPQTANTFDIRSIAPDILLLANLGAVQLNYELSINDYIKAVEMIKADALYLHLNPLQEALQPEGDRNFSNLLSQIKTLCQSADFPILAKECGCGISGAIARQLKAAGIQGIEVSGAGGTSWAKIEGQRGESVLQQRLGQTFANWGIPTTESILLCREAIGSLPLIASGGIRTGLDAAKALALGADFISIARPLLKPALESPEAVMAELEAFIMELKVAMFCVGAKTIDDLKKIPIFKA